jgi:predicted unusual protein kinase regulating ubiquinone biosynthesis (AarF/ABC1/UbiB family)
MMAADLDNVSLLRRMLRVTAPSQDVEALIAELRERVLEELDYRREAVNQEALQVYFAGHPTISVPAIVPDLSARRVVTSELVTGARFADVLGWSQAERDLAGETLYRFVFRSLYEVHAFNGDPHPGNYIFHGDGKITFLDFGMVKHFTDSDILPLMQMARTLCVDHDPARFRASLEEAGFLVPGADLTDDEIADHLAVFYQLIRESKTVRVTGDYASAVVRRFFDVRSPVAQYARIPRSYVILQRINLGLFALLGEMKATANWRAIAEEIWPFMQAPPTTPMGVAEGPWLASRPRPAALLA